MDRFEHPARLMIVSDLDHTMVDHHDKENLSLLRFNALWESTYRNNSLLVFSTGRSPTLYKELRREKPMLTPDITIMSVGTEITYGEEMVPDNGWEEYLNNKWDKNIVLEESSKFPQLTFQSETEQRPHKVSFYIQKENAQQVMKSLLDQLDERGLDVKLIYSGGMDLDVLPQGAGKGQALAYILKKFNSCEKTPNNTLVCGDSGNDAELFSIEGVHGVMVSNAQEELLHWYEINAKNNPKIIHAKERCAAGIIEAIGHFQLGPATSPRDLQFSYNSNKEYNNNNIDSISNPAYDLVKFYLLYERWLRADIEKSNSVINYFKSVTSSTGIVVHPSRPDLSLHGLIDSFESCYGNKKGQKYFRVWLDKVFVSQNGPNSWEAKFDKWQMNGESRHCCVTTVHVISKKEAPGGFCFTHIHQTWLDGYAGENQD